MFIDGTRLGGKSPEHDPEGRQGGTAVSPYMVTTILSVQVSLLKNISTSKFL